MLIFLMNLHSTTTVHENCSVEQKESSHVRDKHTAVTYAQELQVLVN